MGFLSSPTWLFRTKIASLTPKVDTFKRNRQSRNMPPKRAYGKLTKQQEETLTAWARTRKSARMSIRSLAKKMGVSQSRLSRKIAKRKARTSVDHLRLSDKKIQKEFKEVRDEKARAGRHKKVTNKEISESLQQKTQTGRKFKSPSRISCAVRRAPELRDPEKSPLYGDRATDSRITTYLLHHARVYFQKL